MTDRDEYTDDCADTESIAQELGGIGVDLNDPGTAEAYDTAASWILRAIASTERQRDRLAARYENEVRLLRARHEREVDPLNQRLTRLRGLVESLARSAAERGIFGKKRRSSRTSYGTYGVRRRNETVTVTDPTAAAAWCREHAPEAFETTPPTEVLRARVAKERALAHIRDLGEVPLGFQFVAGSDEPYFNLSPIEEEP